MKLGEVGHRYGYRAVPVSVAEEDLVARGRDTFNPLPRAGELAPAVGDQEPEADTQPSHRGPYKRRR
jgi:hypothetical protein